MAVSKRQKREAMIAAIKEEILKTAPEERPDLEPAHKFYASIRTARSAESIHAFAMSCSFPLALVCWFLFVPFRVDVSFLCLGTFGC